MKWNWGTKLTIWILAFVVFMLVLVYNTFNHEVNLVEKDYYPKGLKYQTRIDAIENAKEINAVFNITQNTDSLIISTPDIQLDSGNIMFFRPSGNSLDRTYDLLKDGKHRLVFPISNFAHGKYILKVNWHHKDKEYYIEQNFFVK